MDKRNWKFKFFKEVPLTDAKGEPVKWNQTGKFELKKTKNTSGVLRDEIDALEKKRSKQRIG